MEGFGEGSKDAVSKRGAKSVVENKRWARNGRGGWCGDEGKSPGKAPRIQEKKTDETEKDTNDG
jgi:hypothetical protein